MKSQQLIKGSQVELLEIYNQKFESPNKKKTLTKKENHNNKF